MKQGDRVRHDGHEYVVAEVTYVFDSDVLVRNGHGGYVNRPSAIRIEAVSVKALDEAVGYLTRLKEAGE